MSHNLKIEIMKILKTLAAWLLAPTPRQIEAPLPESGTFEELLALWGKIPWKSSQKQLLTNRLAAAVTTLAEVGRFPGEIPPSNPAWTVVWTTEINLIDDFDALLKISDDSRTHNTRRSLALNKARELAATEKNWSDYLSIYEIQDKDLERFIRIATTARDFGNIQSRVRRRAEHLNKTLVEAFNLKWARCATAEIEKPHTAATFAELYFYSPETIRPAMIEKWSHVAEGEVASCVTFEDHRTLFKNSPDNSKARTLAAEGANRILLPQIQAVTSLDDLKPLMNNTYRPSTTFDTAVKRWDELSYTETAAASTVAQAKLAYERARYDSDVRVAAMHKILSLAKCAADLEGVFPDQCAPDGWTLRQQRRRFELTTTPAALDALHTEVSKGYGADRQQLLADIVAKRLQMIES